MKLYLFAALLLPTLGGCSSSTKDAEPRPATAAFGQDFALRYRQTATLPAAASPELTIVVADLQYTICPRNADCFAANFAAPTLDITAADGQQQQLKMPTFAHPYNPAWLDTASVRANGRRYLVYYRSWGLDAGKQDNPTKQDFIINLRVEKP